MFKVLKDGKICNLNEAIDNCKSLLEKNKEITIECDDHIQHIASHVKKLKPRLLPVVETSLETHE